MGTIIIQELLLPFITSFVLSLAGTYIIQKVAVKMNWIYIPREDRWNSRVVALMGGIAVFLSFAITYFLFQPNEFIFIGLGATTLFIAGFWDDRYELKPIVKFIIQFLAASLLVTAGYTLNSGWPFWLALPLTYIWIIGITNAFNLLDNMDGLTAGIVVIVSLVSGFLALNLGMFSVAVIAFIMAGSVAGFLVFNYHPAKIFMGDCGSLFIGFILAGIPLMLEPELTSVATAAILPVLIALFIVPIFDTTLVTFVRIFKGRSPSQGGSDHSSHRLIFSGLSEKASVNTLYGVAIYFGLLVTLFYPEAVALFYILFAASLVGLLVMGLYLSRLDVYKKEEPSTLESMVEGIPDFYKRKIQLGAIIIDVVLIIASFTLAHFIRFEAWTADVEQAVTRVLPFIIVLKILILASMGLYKRVWRYAGVADLTRLLIATFLASLASALFAWWYSAGYISVTVFVVDWFLFLFMLAASRFAFKGLRRLMALPTNGGKNVLLYGAGDAGWLALSEIRQNPGLHLDPVGFLDDSSYKRFGKLQGLKVLGGFDELMPVCEKYDVEEVLICMRNISDGKKEFIKQMCVDNNIKCCEFLPVFNELKSQQDEEYSFVPHT